MYLLQRLCDSANIRIGGHEVRVWVRFVGGLLAMVVVTSACVRQAGPTLSEEYFKQAKTEALMVMAEATAILSEVLGHGFTRCVTCKWSDFNSESCKSSLYFRGGRGGQTFWPSVSPEEAERAFAAMRSEWEGSHRSVGSSGVGFEVDLPKFSLSAEYRNDVVDLWVTLDCTPLVPHP